MKFSFLKRAAVTAVVASALVTGGVLTAAPANAATVHNRMVIKINKVKYTIDEWNTSSKTVPYNINCHSTSLWAGYHYSVYKGTGGGKAYLSMDTDPLHAYYLNEHYWAKTRSYKSVADFKKVFKSLETKNLEKVKTSIGYYCLRDTRRDETKFALQSYVQNINYVISRNGDTDLDLSKFDLATDEITTAHKMKKSFSVSGTPRAGYVASVTNKTDGYRWTYTSATDKYTEAKL